MGGAPQCALASVALHGVSSCRAPTRDVLSVATLPYVKAGLREVGNMSYTQHGPLSSLPYLIGQIDHGVTRIPGAGGACRTSYYRTGEWQWWYRRACGMAGIVWPSLKVHSVFLPPVCPVAISAVPGARRFRTLADTLASAWNAFAPDPRLVKFDFHCKF